MYHDNDNEGLCFNFLSFYAYSIGSDNVKWNHNDGFLFALSTHCLRYQDALKWSEGSIPIDFIDGIITIATIPN